MCERLDWSRRTVTKYQQILHHFYEYLIEHGVARSNPVYGIPAIGERRDEAAKPIPEDIRKLLLTTMRQEEPQLALVCELEYYCAIRPNELRQLRIRDIDLRSASIRIPASISKNRTTQSVDVPRQMLEKLRQWKVDEYPPHFFLLGTQGVPGIEGYGKNTLRFRFERIREKLHLSSEYKLYSFKHSGGVELVNAGVDTWQLQRHFRHSSIATTEAYLRRNFAPNSEMIKDRFPDI
ncbi:MAG: site-specific integrase [Bacteroidaceae bacterium]|nr:site-specific integrase [Bacteroidaceae bacterium]